MTFLSTVYKLLGYREVIYIAVHVGNRTMNNHETQQKTVMSKAIVAKDSKAVCFFV